jgi:basic membrane protein A
MSVMAVLVGGALGGCSSSSSPSKTTNNTSGSHSNLKVKTIGYVLSGPADDHGYYENQANEIKALGKKYGIKIILVQNANPSSPTVLEDLARQGAQVIIMDGSEFTPAVIPFAKNPAFARTLPLMISGDPPAAPGYATAGGNELQAHFLGGVAAALVLEHSGGNTACDVAGPKLAFVKNAATAMEKGLQYIDPHFHFDVTFTGDFNNAALATSATKSLLNQGCKVLYPYLGGAIPAALNTAKAGGAQLVATSYNRCSSTNPPFALSILYNPALYLPEIVPALERGQIKRNKQWKLFSVGGPVGVGAVICHPTSHESAVMASVEKKLAEGKINVPKLVGSNIQG